ncbi:hypothetical protein SCWH03_31930 [Streptomyces pacificus]|uniref:Uncharacterized protein n=1 Tax=Streptomyces pacificus TaxID=2705029 RepID=A0A6A0AVJ2_9ACTN|nr:hypothetical protein SCWH03_31930 [Streptomyces pacificus]
MREVVPSEVRDEPGPRIVGEGELRTGALFLGVPYADGRPVGGDLDALAAFAAAVRALEPDEAYGLFGDHGFPSNLSIRARDSRGVRAWARMLP